MKSTRTAYIERQKKNTAHIYTVLSMDNHKLDQSLRSQKNETTEYRKSTQRKKKKKKPRTCWQNSGDGDSDGPVNDDRMKVSKLVQDIL